MCERMFSCIWEALPGFPSLLQPEQIKNPSYITEEAKMNLDHYLKVEGEKPLDRITSTGGFTGIFRTIGCIGDSLSSGEFEGTDPTGTKKIYRDCYEYSWGQYMARAIGSKVYNFSRGGMTAKTYWESFAEENDFWNPDKLCQAYVIALGVNDIINRGQELGAVSDIDLEDYNKNADTFCGYYARIIQRIRAMQPHARFFLMTIPRHGDSRDELRAAHAALLHDMAKVFPYTYVLDFHQYAPVYDGEFQRNFFLGGHMNGMGYILTAQMVMSYIDYIIRQSPEDFAQVAFIGKDVHNYKAPW